MATPSSKYIARIIVAPSKNTVGDVLSIPIVKSCQSALESRDVFTIALSGGSLPSFLQSLPTSFEIAGVDPQWGKWRVLLADERCVESTHEDSNLGSIQKNFTSHVPIPAKHVYGIKESLLSESSLAIARSYEDNVVKPLLEKSGGMLDCVVLGFGPDGHTCSLFPNHPLLLEENAFVASIDDSPKPPPSRITLTFPIINKLSRKVIFCGAGSTKSAILTDIFGESSELACFAASKVEGAKAYDATLNDPAPYPCGMVRPQGKGSLVWVVDADAAKENIFG